MRSKNLQLKPWHKQETFVESQMPALCQTVTEQPQPVRGTAEGDLSAHEYIANVSKLQVQKCMDSGTNINEK